ncbi:hypothetical protein Nepgr_000252 [Nepenthes gracilis]|uniref:Pentatricopeptide repeat-containing protein n=1 Tax=Nepenthes gracilis TaxID=150966 RepID=A0AAD3RWN8_NEPGR|nr:hypothetical protein Nepgr_000252 [Nepenthes gracilis]
MSLPPYAAASIQLCSPPPPPQLQPAKLPRNSTQLTFHNSKQSLLNTTTKRKGISFHQTHEPIDPTVSWTSSIAFHCRNGHLREAVEEFIRMRLSLVEPNHITFITLLSGCAHFPLQNRSLGASIHAHVRKLGLDKENVMVGTALVDLYSKSRLVELARVCFDEIMAKNSVSWNTMIDGYMRNGKINEALELFAEMPESDVITWTALIGGFVKKGLYEQALEWFQEMQLSGVDPDYVTIIAVLTACGNLGALNSALWVSRYVLSREFRDNIRVCNSLIDMYSRCGYMGFAREIFEKMPSHSLVSWNSIISGFAANGDTEDALKYFTMLQKEGFEPDEVSFTGALSACSHAGLVDEGLKLFDEMQRLHKISPRIEHYGCIVDLYSRAGRLEDALNMVKNMQMKPNEVVLGSLLAACRNCGDVSLAEMLMNYLVELDPDCDSNYVLLANMYAAAGSWEGAGNIRRKMKSRGIQKKPGISSIEIDDSIHEFVASDRSHTEMESIYKMLEILSIELRICGYVPQATTTEF